MFRPITYKIYLQTSLSNTMFSVSQSVDATIHVFLPSGYPHAPYQSRLFNFGVENSTGSSFSSLLVYTYACLRYFHKTKGKRKWTKISFQGWLPHKKSLS